MLIKNKTKIAVFEKKQKLLKMAKIQKAQELIWLMAKK